MSADTELLRRYVEERSEAAFAELVQLHLNLVYFAALRLLGGDAHRAEDVTKAVFTDLARKAGTLTERSTLTGWLHTSTRFAAAKIRRADFSRQQRHQEAETMHALLRDDATAAAEWERLRPLIDDVVHELTESDREAVLLRFFENRSFAEIGAALYLSEDAARMRVDRALDKLRRALTRRGIASTTGALALAFGNQLGATPPAGLLANVTAAALSKTTVSSAAMAGGLSGGKLLLMTGGALLVVVATVLVWTQSVTAVRRSVASPVVQTTRSPISASTTSPPARASADAITATKGERTEWKSAAELRAAGRGSPCATLETLMLALVDNDVDTFSAAIRLSPDLREKVEAKLARLPAASRATYAPVARLYSLEAIELAGRNISTVAAIRVLEQRKVDADHATLLAQLQLVSGAIHEHTLRFERATDGWQLLLER